MNEEDISSYLFVLDEYIGKHSRQNPKKTNPVKAEKMLKDYALGWYHRLIFYPVVIE